MGGFGVIFMSSIASSFLPPTTALGAGVYSLALYGGLILFGGFILYDTQKIIHRAESHPNYGYGVKPYDPINNSISGGGGPPCSPALGWGGASMRSRRSSARYSAPA